MDREFYVDSVNNIYPNERFLIIVTDVLFLTVQFVKKQD